MSKDKGIKQGKKPKQNNVKELSDYKKGGGATSIINPFSKTKK